MPAIKNAGWTFRSTRKLVIPAKAGIQICRVGLALPFIYHAHWVYFLGIEP